MPNKRAAAAGNAVVPALLALEHLGFNITVRDSSSEPAVVAVREGEEYMADDPVAVLGHCASRVYKFGQACWCLVL
jgi:hypothetical protein